MLTEAQSPQARWSCDTCQEHTEDGKRRCQNCRLLSDRNYGSIIQSVGGDSQPDSGNWSDDGWWELQPLTINDKVKQKNASIRRP